MQNVVYLYNYVDVCRPYAVFPRLQSTVTMPRREVYGVTQCDKKLFVVFEHTDTIFVFEPNNEQLANIKMEELYHPWDIVACTKTKQLYIAGESRSCQQCVWRVSLDGRQIVNWLPNASTTIQLFSPWTLSVTSRRLLVTSPKDNELFLYGPDGS